MSEERHELERILAEDATFVVPEAAAALTMALAGIGVAVPLTLPEKERVYRALAALNLEEQLRPLREPMDEIAHSIGVLVTQMLSTADRAEREKLRALVQTIVLAARAIERKRMVAA